MDMENLLSCDFSSFLFKTLALRSLFLYELRRIIAWSGDVRTLSLSQLRNSVARKINGTLYHTS